MGHFVFPAQTTLNYKINQFTVLNRRIFGKKDGLLYFNSHTNQRINHWTQEDNLDEIWSVTEANFSSKKKLVSHGHRHLIQKNICIYCCWIPHLPNAVFSRKKANSVIF